ncbi:MAG: hypothetical protein HY782_14275 [Chloroflexi bacterium]|nr:hypothetical protein [Chloroflexota bacterium]
MQKKFGVLRIVATIYKVLGWIVLVIGVLGACGAVAISAVGTSVIGARNAEALGLGTGGLVGGLILGLGAIFFAILYFLLLYAFGELISLLIALEENTRLTAERLLAKPAAETAVSSPKAPMPPP